LEGGPGDKVKPGRRGKNTNLGGNNKKTFTLQIRLGKETVLPLSRGPAVDQKRRTSLTTKRFTKIEKSSSGEVEAANQKNGKRE